MTDDCQVGRAAAICCNSGLEGNVNDMKVRIFQFISKVSPSTVRHEVGMPATVMRIEVTNYNLVFATKEWLN